MLSETVVSALLEASITGAGLVLAVYALITPISEKIFKERANTLQVLIEEFDKEKNKITADAPDKDFKRLDRLRREIKRIRVVPFYWGLGVAATFILFMLSAISDGAWLVQPAQRTSDSEFLIGLLFLWAVGIFFLVGAYTIIEIYDMMKKEFEDIKKKQKEIKVTSANLTTSVTFRANASGEKKND